MKGKVKFFNAMKGFGFISGEDNNEYFVHRSALGEGLEIDKDDTVNFDTEQTDRGLKAVNVSRVQEEAEATAESTE